jgi:hypothetical protein
LPLQSGEIFNSIHDCERRLRGYALAEGFDIVQTGGGKKSQAGARWQCYYHGVATKNWRHLEDHVERDEEGKITSKRQREGTMVGQLDCQWSVRLTWKDVGKRGSGNKAFILTVKCDDHVHRLSTNPLSFPRHRQALEEWQALISTARKHREAVIPYSESRRVLESEDFGITISAREYYNSVRKMVPDKDQPQTINGLLIALQEEGFVYRTRVKIEENDVGKPIDRKMLQIWFTHRQQLDAAARFCSDWLLIIDGTFNTNKDRLPLLIAVGVLNSGKTFPVYFSYCPSESDESFSFVWDSLKVECFKPDQNLPAPPPPRIFLGDQAGGLISSVLKHFPDAQVQSCDWHAVEAMKERFRKSGYKKEEIDRFSKMANRWTLA